MLIQQDRGILQTSAFLFYFKLLKRRNYFNIACTIIILFFPFSPLFDMQISDAWNYAHWLDWWSPSLFKKTTITKFFLPIIFTKIRYESSLEELVLQNSSDRKSGDWAGCRFIILYSPPYVSFELSTLCTNFISWQTVRGISASTLCKSSCQYHSMAERLMNFPLQNLLNNSLCPKNSSEVFSRWVLLRGFRTDSCYGIFGANLRDMFIVCGERPSHWLFDKKISIL